MNNNYIYGRNTVLNALDVNQNVKKVFLTNAFNDQRIIKIIRNKKINYEIVDTNYLNKLVGNVNHQGIVALCEEYSYLSLEEIIKKNEENPNSLFVMLDGIEDPHNLGAILRSVDAFGAQGVIIKTDRQVGLTPTVAKVSTGAIEYVDVCQVVNLNQALKRLKEAGYWIVSTDGEAKMDYREVDYLNMKTVLIVGSEGFGVSKLLLKNSDFIVKIPMVGHVNSLNASVACAVFLAQIYSKRNQI